LEGRLAPPQAGADGLAGEATVRRELEHAAGAVSIAAHRSSWLPCATCPPQQLLRVGGTAEVELDLPLSLRSALRASAARLELHGLSPQPETTVGRRPAAAAYRPGPWDRFGASTLDWPERWELGARLQRAWGPLAATLSASIGAPPADGALSTRGGLKIERSFGMASASLAGAVARLTPAGQVLAEVALSIGVHLGGVP
jgi:hypothetical protein